jgi:hypothetical protein
MQSVDCFLDCFPMSRSKSSRDIERWFRPFPWRLLFPFAAPRSAPRLALSALWCSAPGAPTPGAQLLVVRLLVARSCARSAPGHSASCAVRGSGLVRRLPRRLFARRLFARRLRIRIRIRIIYYPYPYRRLYGRLSAALLVRYLLIRYLLVGYLHMYSARPLVAAICSSLSLSLSACRYVHVAICMSLSARHVCLSLPGCVHVRMCATFFVVCDRREHDMLGAGRLVLRLNLDFNELSSTAT